MTESTFEQDVKETIETYEQATGHFASRTREMIERHGVVEALSRLMLSPDLQQGFKVLRDSGQLLATFEALVTRNASRFRDEVVEAAQWRLENPNNLL